MRASEQEQTAGIGISDVAANFQRIGWGPVVNEPHDLGIDLFVQVRDARRSDRGLLVGVQVKAGKSYFRRRSSGNDPPGWWYYEPNTNHFDDWVTHCLPHLLVLHDVETRTSYWAHTTADSVISTGQGCKILVPETQTIDADHAEDLYAVACLQRATPLLEGTSFSGVRGGVPPGRRLRYALICPRLVAPHPNAGFHNPVDPVEAVALLAQGRFRDLKKHADQHEGVPDPELSPVSEWSWRFVAAFWNWATTGEVIQMGDVFDDAPNKEAKAASGVLLACALRHHERYRDSIDVLSRLLEDDNLGPVDHGWTLVQRARTLADLGDIPQARKDAVTAQQTFRGDHNDVTVSALASAAAWLLFTTARQASPEPSDLQRDFEDLITASDTAVSWWRIATVAWGLSSAESRQFRYWAEHLSQPPDSGTRYLFAAAFNADITSEHNSWRAISALEARQRLMNAATSADQANELNKGLNSLRQSGDHQSFKRAFSRIKQDGPLETVITLLQHVPPLAEWTHTTTDSNFEALAGGGDFLDEHTATELACELADLIEDPLEFAKRLRPSGIVSLFALNAVHSLLPAAKKCAHNRVANLVSTLVGAGQIPRLYLVKTLDQIDFRQVLPTTKETLWARTQQDPEEIGSTLLGWLSDHDYPHAKSKLIDRASRGDHNALRNLCGLATLDSSDAGLLIPWLEKLSQRVISDANCSNSTYGGLEPASSLTSLNLQFPSQARWGRVLDLLANPLVSWQNKRPACWLIAEKADQLPAAVRDTLAANIASIATASTGFFIPNAIGGIGTVLATAIGALGPTEAKRQALTLACGSVAERKDVALLLGLNLCPDLQPLLASQIGDPHPQIRSAAAQAVGRLIRTDPSQVLCTLAEELAKRDGMVVPTHLLIGLSQGDTSLSAIGIEVARTLQNHPSAGIRGFARLQLQGAT